MLSDCLVIRVQKVFVLLRVGLGVAIYKRSVDSLILLLDSLCGHSPCHLAVRSTDQMSVTFVS
jgi:hypothetical protein